MLISANYTWLTPVPDKKALLERCRRVLTKLNADPAETTFRVRYGTLPDKSRAFGEKFSTLEEASAAFCARADADFEFALDVDDHTLHFSASFDGMIPIITLSGGIYGGLSPLVEKYRLTDTIDGLYCFSDQSSSPYGLIQNARFFDLLLAGGGFEHPPLTSWDKVFAMYRLLDSLLDRIGAYARLNLSLALCLERREYPLLYESYAGIVISECLKATNRTDAGIIALQAQCVELTGRTLSDIYETDGNEAGFVDLWFGERHLEIVEDLAEDSPEFAALLARDVPKFAALLERIQSDKRNAEPDAGAEQHDNDKDDKDKDG
ncbi:MAG: hypothetical protein V4671_00355 [Armatimonadota bacterium]